MERAAGYIETSFFEGRLFTDLDDLNAQLIVWLARVTNVRCHGTTGERPVDRLAEDQPAMLALVEPHTKLEVEARRADWDSGISFRGVRYSVDPSILNARRGTPVEVRLGADEKLRVRHQGCLVGEHALAPPGSPPQDDLAHAQARRRLRQQPPSKRPREKTPRFEQRPEASPRWVAVAPVTVDRPLAVYEEVLPCRLS